MAKKEYQCRDCHEFFTIEEGEAPTCPECHSTDVQLIPELDYSW